MTTLTESAVSAANCALGRLFFAEQDRLRGGPAEELCADVFDQVLFRDRFGPRDQCVGAGIRCLSDLHGSSDPGMYLK